MASDPVITTGIDRLMDYVAGRDEAPVQDAAEALGVDRDTIVMWANALEDAGLIEIRFSARRGRVLVPTSGDVDDEALDEVREETKEAVAEIQELRQAETELEEFEDLLERIEEGLDTSEDEVRDIGKALGGADDLEAVREFVEDLETAEEDIADMQERLDDAIAGLKVLERMVEEQDESDDDTGREGPGLLGRLVRAIPFVGGGEERFKCEECGKEFGTEHGLKTHRGIAHDD